jgi:hypothetical protein
MVGDHGSATRYHKRAEQLRMIARTMTGRATRETMRMAEDYEARARALDAKTALKDKVAQLFRQPGD